MKDKISIIAGGSGQFGVYLSQFLLKKGYKIIITSRNVKLAKKKIPFTNKNLILVKLNVQKKKKFKNLFLNIVLNLYFTLRAKVPQKYLLKTKEPH